LRAGGSVDGDGFSGDGNGNRRGGDGERARVRGSHGGVGEEDSVGTHD